MNFEFRILNFEFALFSLENTHGFAEALKMHDLALAEEFYYVVYVGVIREAEDVIIHRASLLLC